MSDKKDFDKMALTKILQIKKELLRREAMESFEKFLLYINYDFWSPRIKIKKFQEVIKDAELLEKGYIDFLMVSLPAGFGKSYLRECWNAWVIGRNINNTILVGTYSDLIAKTFTQYFSNIITSVEYIEIFGNKHFEKKTQNEIRLKGTLLPYTHFSRGAGASTTGTRAKFIQVDDILKDHDESKSELILDKRWNWYNTTLKTRKSENTLKEFWCGTRWTKNDPMGRKIEEMENQMEKGIIRPYKVKIHAIPAMISVKEKDNNGKEYSIDKSICEDWTTTEELIKIKDGLATMPEVWEGLYQQKPIDSIGALFPETKIKTFNSEIELYKMKNKYGEIGVKIRNPNDYNVFTVADVADTGDDYHAVGVFGYNITKKTFILFDVIFTQDGVEKTAPEHSRLIIEHNAIYNRIEKNNFGKFYAKEVERNIAGKARAVIKQITTKINKEQKIYLWSGFILEMIQFRDDWKLLPESHPYKQMMKNLISYDRSGKNKHDDAADMMAMAGQTISKQFNIINATLKAFNQATKGKEKDIER